MGNIAVFIETKDNEIKKSVFGAVAAVKSDGDELFGRDETAVVVTPPNQRLKSHRLFGCQIYYWLVDDSEFLLVDCFS